MCNESAETSLQLYTVYERTLLYRTRLGERVRDDSFMQRRSTLGSDSFLFPVHQTAGFRRAVTVAVCYRGLGERIRCRRCAILTDSTRDFRREHEAGIRLVSLGTSWNTKTLFEAKRTPVRRPNGTTRASRIA